MNYVARASTLEAKPVTLGGQALMAVLLDGAPLLVNADAFGALYAEVEEEQPQPVPFKFKPKADAPVAQVKRPAAAKKSGEPGPSAILVELVREQPSTTAELQDRLLLRVNRNVIDKANREWAYQAIWAATKAKKLVKKTDPKTQLSRIYPGEAA